MDADPALTQPCGPGRPRAYDREAVLNAALDVFWERGYETASTEELCAAMGLAKSSFYGCFGSKRGALLEALAAYNERGLVAMQARAAAAGGGAAGAFAVLRHMVTADGDARGCFLVNAVTELAAGDAEIAAVARTHIGRIEALFERLLEPDHGSSAPAVARAAMALGFGASALRKAGVAPDRLEAMATAAARLVEPPG